jgi:hypothetical protein
MDNLKFKRAVVAIYVDPDFYPPTINAILNLSECFDEVIVVSRNNAAKDFPYPANVSLKKVGSNCTVRQMEKQSLWKKGFYFFKFCLSFLKYAGKKDTELILIYDSIALYAYYLTKNLIGKKTIWYHNHDMQDRNLISSYSIGGLAAKFQKRAMRNIRYFSLPAKERLVYFPGLKESISTFIIPNYPSLKVYKKDNSKPKDDCKTIRIIYQGFIGAGHSLEELITLLPEKINGYNLELILKGSVTDAYRNSIRKTSTKLGVDDKVHWLAIGPYSELPELTCQADIGIGINKNTDIVSMAQGTASNKIYEYAASGLPVILYNSEQFVHYLASYEWTYFSNGSATSLRAVIGQITARLKEISMVARRDFESHLNFEQVFQPVLKKVLSSLKP